MNITDTRRANLSLWVAKNGIPQKEKSLFSQLRGDGSFGERVARRLERDYRMGDGFLDTPPPRDGETALPVSGQEIASLPAPRWMDPDAFRFLNLFDALNQDERNIVIAFIEDIAAARGNSRGVSKG